MGKKNTNNHQDQSNIVWSKEGRKEGRKPNLLTLHWIEKGCCVATFFRTIHGSILGTEQTLYSI